MQAVAHLTRARLASGAQLGYDVPRVPPCRRESAPMRRMARAALLKTKSDGNSPLTRRCHAGGGGRHWLRSSDAQLPDQHGGSDSLAAHRGNAVVVVVVDARRLGTVRRWEQDLLTRFPKLHVLTVADVNETRPTTVERVSSRARPGACRAEVTVSDRHRSGCGRGNSRSTPPRPT